MTRFCLMDARVKPGHDRSIWPWRFSLARVAVQFRPAHSTLLPHNFHRLAETGAQNMHRGEWRWGFWDVSSGRFPSHYSRLDAPPLSTGAALHARPGTEVARASRPIACSRQPPVGFARAVLDRRHGRDRQLTPNLAG